MTPEVSVLMPVRNGAAFLTAAVESILHQDFTEFELIIVDDGSTDATPMLLADFAARDKRLVLLQQPALGLVAALNRGLAAARAPLVARMDADDVAMKQRLGLQLAFLAANPEIALVGSAMEVIDAQGRPLRNMNLPTTPQEIRKILPVRNCIAHPTVMFRRAAVAGVGGYRAQFAQAEDYELWLRLSERHALAALPAPLLQYRQHLHQITWLSHEQRILSELTASAAAEVRGAGRADPAAAIACADKSALRICGWSEAQIALAIATKAVDTARAARQAKQKKTARAAMNLALRQPPLRLRPRLRCLLEWLLSWG